MTTKLKGAGVVTTPPHPNRTEQAPSAKTGPFDAGKAASGITTPDGNGPFAAAKKDGAAPNVKTANKQLPEGTKRKAEDDGVAGSTAKKHHSENDGQHATDNSFDGTMAQASTDNLRKRLAELKRLFQNPASHNKGRIIELLKYLTNHHPDIIAGLKGEVKTAPPPIDHVVIPATRINA